MQVSDPYLRHLVDLWSPPSIRYHTGTVIGFEGIEQELGLTLPRAYKELVHVYGQGAWFETIYILNPFYAWLENLEPWYSRQHGCGALKWCDRLRAERGQFPHDFIHPIYPEPGGIFPYALFYGIRGTLYWLTSEPPDDWKSLFDLGGPSSQQEWETFDLSVTELLWRLATEDKTVKRTCLEATIAGFRSTIFSAIR